MGKHLTVKEVLKMRRIFEFPRFVVRFWYYGCSMFKLELLRNRISVAWSFSWYLHAVQLAYIAVWDDLLLYITKTFHT